MTFAGGPERIRFAGRRPDVVVFAVVAFSVALNASQPFGHAIALWGDAILQGAACLGAVGSALVGARRTRGSARAWRLLVAAALTCWTAAQTSWWWRILVEHGGPPALRFTVVAYFAFLLVGLAALVVFSAATRGASRNPWTLHRVSILVFDGLVATAAYAILVWSSTTGMAGVALARSGGRPETLAYPIVSLVVVVAAVVLAIGYRAERPMRTHFVLLAAGFIAIAASDRLVAYFTEVGVESGKLWARAGFVLGPLLIAFAVREFRATRNGGRGSRVVDWAQLLLPYVGALGIAVLFGFHVVIGQRVDGVQAMLAVLMVLMLVGRQLVALQDNRLLVRRVYAGQRRLVHQLHHDALTGLPNRMLFAQRLDAALAERAPFILVYVDLDDFKDVNDQYGHAAGDQLLCAAGRRLQGAARSTDTVARIGGDEFGILVQGEIETPEVFADRFRAALRPPFALHGTSVSVRASMGLVTPDLGSLPRLSSDELMRRADSSMYAGKRAGKDSAVLYRESDEVADFPTALRRANGAPPAGFQLVYQPVVRLSDGVLVAVEALARWTTMHGTQIAPETFVSSAEAAGLGPAFDALVLDMACADVAGWDHDVSVHVNVGAARLGDRAFEQTVSDVLARRGVLPQRLVLEITESVPIVDLAEGAAAIRRLRALGVKVALDDFGAGYNSLTYLHSLPVDIVKLDRALTIGIDPSNDAVLYRSVIGICDELGFDVVAEGIETQAQADTIAAAGARLGQGYRFGRPVPVSEVLSRGALPTAHVPASR